MFVKQILPFMDVLFQNSYCCGENYVLLSTKQLSGVLRALGHSPEEMVTVEQFTEDH